jgi:aspartate/glutamate racemase
VEKSRRDDGADRAILGCTEIGLAIGPEHLPVPAFDWVPLAAITLKSR